MRGSHVSKGAQPRLNRASAGSLLSPIEAPFSCLICFSPGASDSPSSPSGMMRLSLSRIPHCFSLQLCWIAAVARSLLGAGAARGSLEPEFEAMAACMDGVFVILSVLLCPLGSISCFGGCLAVRCFVPGVWRWVKIKININYSTASDRRQQRVDCAHGAR